MVKKWIGIVVMSVLLIFLGIQVYSFAVQEHGLDQNLSTVQDQLSKAQADEANLQSEDQYLSDPANLEKELRTEFNYKKPGETMIIIVPSSSQATATPGTD